MRIPKYIDLFRNEITRLGYRKNTIDNYVGCVDLFLRYFDGKETEPSKSNYTEKQYKHLKLFEEQEQISKTSKTLTNEEAN